MTYDKVGTSILSKKTSSRPRQISCRVCRRKATGSRINGFRICDRCQPGWKVKCYDKRMLKESLNAAYYLLAESISCCEICGKEPRTRRLAVDHNHLTGEIRGLLCYNCNCALSFFGDNAEVLRLAAEYLSRKSSLIIGDNGTVEYR